MRQKIRRDRYLCNAIGFVLVAVTVMLLLRGKWSQGHAAKWKDRAGVTLASRGWGAVIGAPFLVLAYDATAPKLVGTNVFHGAVLLVATSLPAVGGVELNLLP